MPGELAMTAWNRIAACAVAVAGLSLAAGTAQAVSSINIIWKSSETNTISPMMPSTLATALIVLEGDATGIGGVFVTILFDTNELDFISAKEHMGGASFANTYGWGGKGGTQTLFHPVSPGVSAHEASGTIEGFDSFGSNVWGPYDGSASGAGCISCTITLGSVIFRVTNPVDNDGPNDVRLAVLPGDGVFSAAGGPNGYLTATPDFGSAEIAGAPVPEPATALLLVAGLLGCGYAGRRSAR